jgi:hypothetical protein
MRIREAHPFARKPINIGRLHKRLAVTRHFRPDIFQQNPQNVRTRRLLSGHHKRQQRQAEKQELSDEFHSLILYNANAQRNQRETVRYQPKIFITITL